MSYICIPAAAQERFNFCTGVKAAINCILLLRKRVMYILQKQGMILEKMLGQFVTRKDLRT